MESPAGLRWLVRDGWPGCLVFVRGVSEDRVFRAFGADPGDAVPRRLGEPPPYAAGAIEVAGVIHSPAVEVGQAGEWIVAMDYGMPLQGVRPEVLRRVSSGGEAVALYADIGKLNHQFGYAADGDVIAALTTCVPPHWSGSDPGRFEPLARELGLTEGADPPGELTGLEAVLLLAERVFGLSLARADLDRLLPCAPVLPVLADLLQRPPAGQVYRIGDPVIDLLMSRADPRALAAVAASRVRRLMAATGLDAHPELAAAVEAAVAGNLQQPGNDEPAGRLLRRIARDQSEAEHFLAAMVNLPPLPVPEAELRNRVRQGDAAWLLRLLLDGRHPGQLLAAELHKQRIWDARGWQEPLAWRAQAIADFSVVEVPAAELRAAEEAWLADPEPVRGRQGMIDARPVRVHVSALIAAGMDPRRVAELSGRTTAVFIDTLLRGYIKQVTVEDARSLLAIPVPDDPSHQPSR